MKPHLYILEGHVPVPIDDVITWAKWFESADRRVAYTDVSPTVHVSTVFLGTDHSFGFGDKPLLFETMVFRDGEACGDELWRHSTWDQAVSGHAIVVAAIIRP